MKKLAKKYIHFQIIQTRWGRKWFGGVYFKIYALQLGILPFWSDEPITSSNTCIMAVETYK